VAELIRKLKLRPHPEGGYFAQVHLSTEVVRTERARLRRPALTSIYYLMERGDCSHWHWVRSDEAWYHLAGAPIEQFRLDAATQKVKRVVIGPLNQGGQPQVVVKGGLWQASRSQGGYSLVGCAVGPGFVYEDFALMRENGALKELIERRYPKLAKLL
jgi:uncharacterized protein